MVKTKIMLEFFRKRMPKQSSLGGNFQRTLFWSFLSGTLFLLTGCNPASIFKPDSADFVEESWRKPAKKYVKPKPLYCYNTLGEKVCYTSPLPDGDKRLSGYYGTQP